MAARRLRQCGVSWNPPGGVGDCDSLAVETSRHGSHISSVPAIWYIHGSVIDTVPRVHCNKHAFDCMWSLLVGWLSHWVLLVPIYIITWNACFTENWIIRIKVCWKRNHVCLGVLSLGNRCLWCIWLHKQESVLSLYIKSFTFLELN